MCLFMCKKHLKHCNVKCVQNIKKNAQAYFGSGHLLQNPTVPTYAMGFSYHTQRFTGPNYLGVDSCFVQMNLIVVHLKPVNDESKMKVA